MIKILAIAPYKGMAEGFHLIAKKRDDISMTIETGNLGTGVQIAKENIHNNYDVIISRGGTASLLRKEFDIPVVDVSISVYDMLRAIKLAENYTDKSAIVGYPSITKCAGTLCDLLQYKIDIVTFHQDIEVAPTLNKLKNQGYSMVLCDMIGSTTAHQIGLNSILITSGPESIESAVNEALRLCQSFHFVHKQKELFQKMFLESDSKALLFTGDGKLTFSSFSDKEEDHDILSYIRRILPVLLDNPIYRTERKYRSYIVSICGKHIYYEDQLYLAVYIHKKELLAYPEDNCLTVFNKTTSSQDEPDGYYNTAAYVGNLRSIIEDYGKSTFPVLIIGETGTGKDKAASLIYETGPYQNNPFYMIDCSLVTEKKWAYFLENENSPFCSVHSTIYLKNIEHLSATGSSRLITVLDSTNLCRRNRMVFSAAATGSEYHSLLTDYLSRKLSCLTLYIPPLRERSGDIPSIISIYLNQLNTSVGKEIIGFEPDALAMVQGFPWKGNLDQFKRILKELVITTHGSYITKETTCRILKKEMPYSSPSLEPGTSVINIDQSLNDINYDIVRLVLEDENGNQGRAAKRLEISRSTLWRMMKSRESSKSSS